MHPSSASADLPRIANLAVLLRQNCFFIALFPAELGGTTTGTAGRTVCKSCTAHHKKSPDRMAWGSWWSIVHSRRTFKQAYHCCGQSASNQETAAPRNASALARVLFSVDIRAEQCCPADHADFGRLHNNRLRTVCR